MKKRRFAHLALIALTAVPLHLALALGTELSPDEAYYLCAARLGPGTVLLDHPPMVRWMLQLSDGLAWMPLELRVRLWAIVCTFVSTGIMAALAARYSRSERAEDHGVLAAWVFAWSLLPTAGGFVTTPDGPALLAIAAALWLDAGGRSLTRSAGVGLLMAGAMVSKVVALPVSLAIAWGMFRDAKAPRERVAALLPVLGALAALPWAWPSFRFQMHHAYGPSLGERPGAIGALSAAVSVQFLLWPAIVVWDGARQVLRRGSDLPAGHRALVVGLTALIAASALVRGIPPEPNWWAPAALIVVAAGCTAPMSAQRKRILVALMLVPTVVASVHALRPVLPLRPEADPTARLHGWRAGREPTGAAGVGPYGPAAERCVYFGKCEEIRRYFNSL